MKTKIIKIGNSRGIRIPKSLIEGSGLEEDVELELNDGNILIRPAGKARSSWEESFRKMRANNDDNLLDSNELNSQSNWDKEEWEW